MSVEYESSTPQLNIITLNCWGLKYLAKDRNARLIEIGARIAASTPTPHIVGLQECWTQEDYRSIRDHTRGILPYGKFYHSGIFGGGLAILSKWPILESNMVRYPLNGRPTAFFRGDWFVGKGIACARIKIGPRARDVAEVFTTHLHAPYEREPNDSYICHRTAQAWEIAKLMRGAAERGHLVVALGDFNMIPLSLAHQLITTHAPVQDVWRVMHPNSSIGAATYPLERSRGRPMPTAEYNLSENGATCDSVLNTWRWGKGQQKKLNKGEDVYVDEQTQDPRAKRLDYIFIGDGASLIAKAHGHLSAANGEWLVQDVRVGMTERHPVLKCSLSDHFSVETSLRWQPNLQLQGKGSAPGAENSSIDYPLNANEHLEVEINGQLVDGDLRPNTCQFLPSSTYDEILAMISVYIVRERRQRRIRLSHFVCQTTVAIGCLIAVWWSPRNFVSFLLMLLSTLGLGAGLLDGLIGGLFVGSELRALKEFEWEIRNARRAAGGETEKEGTRREVQDWYD
ncbi:MAG: phospholipase C type enzyme [Pycnora praestabilis]|nr:MAG: phospholipase C type enzyme [Pycnora praestabilis]